MTEWVKEDNWSKVQLGQHVRLENRDGAVEFHVTTHQQTRDCWEVRSEIGTYAEWNWNLFVEATPEPVFELPEVVGAVVHITVDDNRRRLIAWRANDGTWDIINPRGEFEGKAEDPLAYARNWGEVTQDSVSVLEPVPVTAKRVLDAVSQFAWADGFTPQLAKVAREFGVTGD